MSEIGQNKNFVMAIISIAILVMICGYLIYSLTPDSEFTVEVPHKYNAEYFTYQIYGKGFMMFLDSEYKTFPYTLSYDAYSNSDITIKITYYNTSYSIPPNGTNIEPSLLYHALGSEWIDFTVKEA